ncbi:MAG: hypothetical protein FJZ96_03860 [Chloroflexi bacterium]|nr:hypothetical protein [Chloroflexota bacterium]
MNEIQFSTLSLLFIGVLLILSAWLDWHLALNPGKLIPRLFGAKGARIVYTALGLTLAGGSASFSDRRRRSC